MSDLITDPNFPDDQNEFIETLLAEIHEIPKKDE